VKRRDHKQLAAVAIALSVASCSGVGRADPAAGQPDPWFGTDKALHFGVGFGLGAAGYGIGAAGFEDRLAAVALASGLVLGLGAAKEGLDALGLGTASYKDFIWTAVGGTLAIGVTVTFDVALRGTL